MNSSQFSHYAESAGKMHSIHHFFNNFVILNAIKTLIYFTTMPANLSEYSSHSISEYSARLTVNIVLSIIMSYRDLYENRANQKKSRLCFLAAAFFIMNELTLVFSSSTNLNDILSIGMVIAACSALKKYNELDKLCKLKGYPLFSESLDNPQYTAASAVSSIPPAIMNAANVKVKSVPAAPPPVTVNPLPVKNHVSVRLDGIKAPEISDMTEDEVPKRKCCAEIPDARDIPAEARLLGNAAIEYSAERLSDIAVSPIDYTEHKTKKKINLSKERNI